MKKLFLLLIALTLFSCDPKQTTESPERRDSITQVTSDLPVVENDTLVCATKTSADPLPSQETLMRKNRLARTTGSPLVTTLIIVDSHWNGVLGGADKVKSHFQNVFAQVAKEEDSKGFRVAWVFDFLTAERDPFTSGNRSQLLVDLHNAYPVFAADQILYVGYNQGGNIGIANDQGTVGVPGRNAAVVFIDKNVAAWPTPFAAGCTIYHELNHLAGCPHTHDCVHELTVNGVLRKYTQIDNIGTRMGYGVACPAENKTNPILPAIGSNMSYAIPAFRKFDWALHPYHLELKKQTLAKAKLGCWNTVYNVRFKGGVITLQDDYSASVNLSYAPFKPGNTKFGSVTKINRSTGTESFSVPFATTYTSSNTTGYRFNAGKSVSGYDRVRITYTGTLASKAEILSSAWLNGKSIGKQINFTKDQTAPFSAFGVSSLDRIQVRPTVESDVKITGVYLEKDGASSNEFSLPIATQPNTFYIARFEQDCGGFPKTTWFVTAPAKLHGSSLTDSGGVTGLFEENQDYWHEPMQAAPGKKLRMDFAQFVLKDSSNKLAVYLDGELYGSYTGNTPPPAIETAKRVDIRFVSKGIRAAGYKIDLTEK